MYCKATRTQIKLLLSQWGALLAFLLLLALALNNFVENVLEFQGTDALLMYHPAKMLSLSHNRSYYMADTIMMLVQLVPLLICIPAALSLSKEQHTGESVAMVARLGARTYLFSKITAVFVVTTLVFSVPFLIELALNCISFPLKGAGDFGNGNLYGSEYIEATKNYLFYPIYRISPYLYTVVGILHFGMVMGLLAAATTTLSALVRVKFRVVLLLPAFLLLELSAYLSQFFDVYWAHYVTLFHGEPRNDLVFWVVVLALLAFVIVGTLCASRKDWLS